MHRADPWLEHYRALEADGWLCPADAEALTAERDELRRLLRQRDLPEDRATPEHQHAHHQVAQAQQGQAPFVHPTVSTLHPRRFLHGDWMGEQVEYFRREARSIPDTAGDSL